MKIKQFRSILALAVVTASVTASLSPAQAFTWDDAWNAVKRGYENTPSSNSPQQQSNNETPQTSGFNNDTPQPQTTRQQNNDSAPSAPTPSPRRVFRSLRTSCVLMAGNNVSAIGQDNSYPIVSVGQRFIQVTSRLWITNQNPHQTTCAITVHPTSEKVALGFAIPDGSTLGDVKVSIYVDGQVRIGTIMNRGQVRRYIFDVTGASSYAYTLEPLSNGSNNVGDIYFPRTPQPRPVISQTN